MVVVSSRGKARLECCGSVVSVDEKGRAYCSICGRVYERTEVLSVVDGAATAVSGLKRSITNMTEGV